MARDPDSRMDERFKRHWDRWHALTAAGSTPAEFLATASDETLVELLAYAGEGTAVERNVIATELTNRISRFHRNISGHGERIQALVDANVDSLGAAARADEEIRDRTDSLQAETRQTSRYTGDTKREGDW